MGGSVIRIVLDHVPVVGIDLVVGDLDHSWFHQHASEHQSTEDRVNDVKGADLWVEVKEQVLEFAKSDERRCKRPRLEVPLRRPSSRAPFGTVRPGDLLGCGLADANLEHQPAVANP